MECGKVREKLAAYLEGAVTAEEGLLIRNHVSSCAGCGAAMEDLKKTGTLLKSLEEVEPPAWLTQKVMAHVREEAEKKGGMLGWLFYPLRVKVPIEALAALLIVGMAAYVYRVNTPRFEEAGMAGKTGQVLRRDRLPEEFEKGIKAPVSSPPEQGSPQAAEERARAAAGRARAAEERQAGAERSVQGPRPETSAEENEPLPREPSSLPAAKKAPAMTEQPANVPGAQAPQRTFRPEASIPGRTKAALSRQGSDSGQRATEAPPPAYKGIPEKGAGRLDFTLRVKDVGAAAQEVERILGEAGARHVTRESLEGAESVTGVMETEEVKGLFRKLRGVGEIGDFNPGVERGDVVAVRVGIVGGSEADKKGMK